MGRNDLLGGPTEAGGVTSGEGRGRHIGSRALTVGSLSAPQHALPSLTLSQLCPGVLVGAGTGRWGGGRGSTGQLNALMGARWSRLQKAEASGGARPRAHNAPVICVFCCPRAAVETGGGEPLQKGCLCRYFVRPFGETIGGTFLFTLWTRRVMAFG